MESLAVVKTIAVVGATGYIGRSVLAAASLRGWTVVTCDRAGVATAWESHWGESVDAVVNCVGTGMNSDEQLSSEDLLAANVVVPIAAAKLALRLGCRLVHLGTAAQHSEQLTADSPYVRSKHLASDALRLITENDGLSVCELRPHIVYGGANSSGVVNAMVTSILARVPFPLRTPNVVRDFVHIDDVSQAVIAGIEAPTPPWISLDIGTGDGHRLSDVAAMIGELAEVSDPWQFDPAPGRPWSEDLVADPIAAKTILGFSATIPLRVGLTRMVGNARKGQVA